MKDKFFDKATLRDLIVGIVGTVTGIVLTFGVTYCSDSRNKDEMARKTVTLAIHNIDASIAGMQRLVDDLRQQDSLFMFMREQRERLHKISADTLDLFIRAMYSRNVRPVDKSTENIFSSSFEIWRHLDDPRVIGRIANCYSILNSCSGEYGNLESERLQAANRFNDDIFPGNGTPAEEVKAMLGRKDIVRIMDSYPETIALLQLMVDKAVLLNEKNKQELGLSQQELDNIGNLL